LATSKAHDDGAMIPKYPPERGKRNEAGEAVDVEQAFDFCHADIVTEFRESAITISSGFFQGIRALASENHPLKNAKSLFKLGSSG
jgi:hypothetical protein